MPPIWILFNSGLVTAELDIWLQGTFQLRFLIGNSEIQTSQYKLNQAIISFRNGSIVQTFWLCTVKPKQNWISSGICCACQKINSIFLLQIVEECTPHHTKTKTRSPWFCIICAFLWSVLARATSSRHTVHSYTAGMTIKFTLTIHQWEN